jgi:hypothetical protein
MKTLLIALLCLSSSLAHSTPSAKASSSGEIQVDGNLSEASWQNAAINVLTDYRTGEHTNGVSTVKISHDQNMLYFGFDIIDRDIVTKFSDPVKNHDAHLFKGDDLVEIFIDPDGDGKNYVELGINFTGVKYDVLIKSPKPWRDNWSWDYSNIQSAVKKEDSGHVSIEIAIDLNELKSFGYKSIDKLRLNVYRIDRNSSKEVKSKYLALFPLYSKGFHQPKKFGALKK